MGANRRTKGERTVQHYFCSSTSKRLRRIETDRELQRCTKGTKGYSGLRKPGESRRLRFHALDFNHVGIENKGNPQRERGRRCCHAVTIPTIDVQNIIELSCDLIVDLNEESISRIPLSLDPATSTPFCRAYTRILQSLRFSDCLYYFLRPF